MIDLASLELRFTGEIRYWRGPPPHHFVSVPADEAGQLHAIASVVTYGWGMVPVRVRLGRTTWATSLFPKDGGYLVPIRATVRAAESVGPGDAVTLQVTIRA